MCSSGFASVRSERDLVDDPTLQVFRAHSEIRGEFHLEAKMLRNYLSFASTCLEMNIYKDTNEKYFESLVIETKNCNES